MVKYIKLVQVRSDKPQPHTQMATKESKMKEPKLDTEFGWSVFKGMFILLIFTNMLWAGLFSYYVHKSVADVSSSTEVWQDGTNNNQSVTNG